MSTHKYFDRICCVVLAVTLALTVLFVNAEQLGVQKASSVMGYEQKLFDTSKVHTIDILMDDWDSFLADCESEEYSNCTVVIDNDAYKNVAIRAKGNTSLTQVASYGNNRYSFKIEFDHYDSSKTYYGLDKLCLNNIIQDNTYMKDYLTYQMMAAMGVASPLCSYVYITVNGEDWGLYLAVEGIEEAFLQRNYGKNYGTLYKPDSMNMGGGRGNGVKFSMDDFLENFDFDSSTASGPQMSGADDPASFNRDPSRFSENPSSEPSTETDSEVSSDADVEADSEVRSDADVEADSEVRPNADMAADSKVSPNADMAADSKVSPNADMAAGSKMSPNADMAADSKVSPNADIKADSKMSSDADIKADSETAADSSAANSSTTESPNGAAPEQPFSNHSGFQPEQMPSGEDRNMPQMPDGEDGNMPQMPGGNNTVSKTTDDQNGTMPQLPDGDSNMPQMPDGDSNMPQMSGGEDGNMPQMPGGEDGNMPQMPDGDSNMPQMPDGDGNMPQMPGGGGRGMMNSSDDVLLKYIDDNPESYSNIWDNAKTDLSDSDKTRLIAALKQLSEGEDLENTVDITAVISYFVVHNFVLNFDSYTGSMIHNYYLYEKDGQMQMIPWDYNLAFGGFESAGSASNLVNYPIDSPVSGGTVSDRPMIAWIFENQEYTDLYHQIFASFLADYFDNGYFEEMMDSLTELISPYVEKDPTKFCTLEEFETGVSTLKEFCLLRAESIQGQLDGTISSTSDTQNASDLIDASHLSISDMGSMNNSMGAPGNFDFSEKKTFLQNFMNTQKEDQEESDTTAEFGQDDHSIFGSPPDASGTPMESAAPSAEALTELAICGLVLLIGLLTAGFYRRRR